MQLTVSWFFFSNEGSFNLSLNKSTIHLMLNIHLKQGSGCDGKGKKDSIIHNLQIFFFYSSNGIMKIYKNLIIITCTLNAFFFQ